MRVGREPPHILVTETVTASRRASIAGASRCSVSKRRTLQAWHRGPSLRTCPGGDARAGKHRKIEAQEYENPKAICYEHWILGSVAVSKAVWGRGRFLPTHRMPPATHPALILAGILFSGMFGSGVNPDSRDRKSTRLNSSHLGI